MVTDHPRTKYPARFCGVSVQLLGTSAGRTQGTEAAVVIDFAKPPLTWLTLEGEQKISKFSS